jgi:hypothetical protein
MKTKLLLISEETILERIKELEEYRKKMYLELKDKTVDMVTGQISILNEILSSLAKPLVIPSDEEVENQSIVYSDDGDGDWDEIISEHFSQGAKFVIDKINSQL